MSDAIKIETSRTPETWDDNNVVPLFSNQHPLRTEEGVFDLQIPETHPTSLIHGEVTIGRGNVQWTLEIPAEPAEDCIGIFSPGYLGIKQSSRSFRHALASEQHIANLTYSPAREDDRSWLEVITNPQELHAKTLATISDNLRSRQWDIEQAPGGEALDSSKLVLLAHSMGGLAIPRFAHMETGSVFKMIGLMTCGFGYPTIGSLALDTPKKLYGSVRHELIPALTQGNLELSMRNVSDAVHYYRRLRVLFEGLSCLREDMTPLIQDLRDKSVPYDYVAAKHDFLVRPDPSVEARVSHHHIIDNIGHLGPQAKPGVVAAYVAERIAA